MAEQKRTDGEQLAVADGPTASGAEQAVEGIDSRTSPVNPDSGVGATPHPTLDAHGGSEQGGMAGP
ncbi:MAG: hypothetical protein AB7K36_20270, partial [Chloroflexota bacterium]